MPAKTKTENVIVTALILIVHYPHQILFLKRSFEKSAKYLWRPIHEGLGTAPLKPNNVNAASRGRSACGLGTDSARGPGRALWVRTERSTILNRGGRKGEGWKEGVGYRARDDWCPKRSCWQSPPPSSPGPGEGLAVHAWRNVPFKHCDAPDRKQWSWRGNNVINGSGACQREENSAPRRVNANSGNR